MDKIYARLIIKGLKTMDDVPAELRETVLSAIEMIEKEAMQNE